MSRFWLLLLLVLMLGSLVQLLGPPWLLAAVAFGLGLGLPPATLGRVFSAGFWGGFGSWILPAWWLNFQNNGLLAGRVAELLPLGGRTWLLLLVTGLVGGLLGGLASWAGAAVRQAATRPARANG